MEVDLIGKRSHLPFLGGGVGGWGSSLWGCIQILDLQRLASQYFSFTQQCAFFKSCAAQALNMFGLGFLFNSNQELRFTLKCYYDENHIFSIEAILRHKQVACMRRKMLFTIFKYLFLFQRYSSF